MSLLNDYDVIVNSKLVVLCFVSISIQPQMCQSIVLHPPIPSAEHKTVLFLNGFDAQS